MSEQLLIVILYHLEGFKISNIIINFNAVEMKYKKFIQGSDMI